MQEDGKELKVRQLALVLVHHPAKTDAENIALWQGMEQALAQNLTRSIGLSNFNAAQITALLKVAKVPPAVNQCREILRPVDERLEACRSGQSYAQRRNAVEMLALNHGIDEMGGADHHRGCLP